MDKLYRLIIFDCDGTLVTTKSGATFRKSADDWQLLPGRKEKLAELSQQGIKLAIATNQDGVAFGYMQEADILREILAAGGQLGISTSGIFVCCLHPKAGLPQYRIDDYDRKPSPGMLLNAMALFEETAETTLYVGDREEDAQAAINADCAFMWASDFFAERCGHCAEPATIVCSVGKCAPSTAYCFYHYEQAHLPQEERD